MSAKLVLIGALKDYTGGKREIPVDTGCTVRDTLNSLGIPAEIVALVLVNEAHQTKDYFIQEGDVVKVMAVIGGG